MAAGGYFIDREEMTTVGYGDACPTTPLGKVLGSFIAILGIGMFAVPTGIMGAGFVEEMHRHRDVGHACPHCGKEIHPPGRQPGLKAEDSPQHSFN